MARILIVDDDGDIRRMLTVILSDEGHTLSVASDGEAALEIVRNERPELVMLDLMMPKVDGFGVLKAMTTLGLRRSTRVVLLTARAAEADWARGFELGADHYLTKPFDIDELVEAVARILEMTPEELADKREIELGRARLLSQLESMFDGA